MHIALLANLDSWYARDLQRAAARHRITTLDFAQLSAGLGEGGRIVCRDFDLATADAVLVRTMPPGSLEQVVFRMDLLARLAATGTVVVNPPKAIEAAVDKYLTSALLESAGLDVPATRVCQDAEQAMQAFAQLGGDVVVKPLFGSEGRGIARLQDEALAERAFKMLAQLHAVLYVQRFVPHEGFDLRLLVIGRRVLAMRRRNLLDWRTNMSRGATAEAFEPDEQLVETARRAAAAIGAPVAGVDLLPGRDGRMYAIEVNAVPGWKALARTTGIDVATLVLDYLVATVKSNESSSSGPQGRGLSLNSAAPAAVEPAQHRGTVNVASRLTAMAERMPEAVAVVEPAARGKRRTYRTISFRELDRDSDVLAGGLRALGIAPGMRIAVLVRPGIDFVAVVFALFKAGAVAVLIDPGMGRLRAATCLAEARPEGMIAIPIAQVVRRLLKSRFPLARYNVTVGRDYFGGLTLRKLRERPWARPELADTDADAPAAVIFTTGSTGPAKGVLYRHGNFDRQVDELREQYAIRPGEIDLAAFPLFALFNCTLGVTTVIPDMDASRPARVNPRRIVEAIEDWQVTQAFGSPAIWDRVGRYCAGRRVRFHSLRRVLSAGAPVPPEVLARMKACLPDAGQVHTPYGATEALPVATIEAGEVLAETQFRWRTGGGTCVGRRFPGIQWMVIRPVDGPIEQRGQIEACQPCEIGELVVRGAVVTREYVTRVESNRLAKIVDGESCWHRMGDVGYLDERERFWFCGRMAHRVFTVAGPMYTIPCEAIFNQHPAIARSALVGLGPPGHQTPAIVCQPRPGQMPFRSSRRRQLAAELRALAQQHAHTRDIQYFLFHRSFPVDIRHNAKIFREKLAVWAAPRLPTLDGEG